MNEFSKQTLNPLQWMKRLLTAIALSSMLGTASSPAFSSEKKSEDLTQQIEADLHLLTAEGENEKALKRLQAIERTTLTSTLQRLLKEKKNITAASQAIEILGLKELTPSLLEVAASSEEWAVFRALARLGRIETNPRINEVLLQSLKRVKSATAQTAILGGLTPGSLPREDFTRLAAGGNPRLELTLLRSLIKERKSYLRSEQIERFRVMFTSSTPQVRLQTLDFFIQLKKEERNELRAAFDEKICASETKPDVKSSCLQLAKLMQEMQEGVKK